MNWKNDWPAYVFGGALATMVSLGAAVYLAALYHWPATTLAVTASSMALTIVFAKWLMKP